MPAPDPDDQITGKERFKHRLTTSLTFLHDVGRMPVWLVQETVYSLTGVTISTGPIGAVGQRLEERSPPVASDHGHHLQQREVVHLERTGRREDGRAGYIRTASSSELCLFRYRIQAKGVVDTFLGDQFSEVFVSDGYGA